MGICLGMQILSTIGFENNKKTNGFDIIPGEVKKMNEIPNSLPHIGWNEVDFNKDDILFENIKINKIFILFTVMNLFQIIMKMYLVLHILTLNLFQL